MIGYARALRRGPLLLDQRHRLADFGVRVVHEDLRGGATVFRPALGLAVRDLSPGDALCVTSLDRIVRAPRDLFGFALMLQQRGAHLVALDDAVDTRSDDGAFYRFARILQDHEERAQADRLLESQADHLPLPPGPPSIISDERWALVAPLLDAGTITPVEAAKRLDVSRATIYRQIRRKRPQN